MEKRVEFLPEVFAVINKDVNQANYYKDDFAFKTVLKCEFDT